MDSSEEKKKLINSSSFVILVPPFFFFFYLGEAFPIFLWAPGPIFFFLSFSWAAQNKSIKNDRKTICNKFLGRFKKNVQFYLLKKIESLLNSIISRL